MTLPRLDIHSFRTVVKHILKSCRTLVFINVQCVHDNTCWKLNKSSFLLRSVMYALCFCIGTIISLVTANLFREIPYIVKLDSCDRPFWLYPYLYYYISRVKNLTFMTTFWLRCFDDWFDFLEPFKKYLALVSLAKKNYWDIKYTT